MQDGSIQYEVKLTGCLSTSILSEGEGMDPTHGTLIGPHLNAQLHQHYFCVRLDMAVDDPDGGAALTVSEVSHPPTPYSQRQILLYPVSFASSRFMQMLLKSFHNKGTG